jgi:23S rRNA pseudouridine1911/1915/1917 synthase
VAKTERAKTSLCKQFENRTVSKTYLAAVSGEVQEHLGYIDAPLGRSPQDRKKIAVSGLAKKEAVTEFTAVFRSKDYSLLEVRPKTGRTHQIRSHLAFIGHPVLGDSVYGGKVVLRGEVIRRHLLHAYRIKFTHPSTCKTVEYCATPPKDIAKLWRSKS